MIHRIIIPNWHPTSVNKLMGHWGAAGRKKTADMQMMATYAHNAKIPKATGKRRLEIEMHIKGAGRTPDPDNFFKSVCDGLKRSGYLIDDGEKWVEITPARFFRGKIKATTLILTDLA